MTKTMDHKTWQLRAWSASLIGCLLANPSLATEALRLLEDPSQWQQFGGGQQSFTFTDGTLALTRHENEPAAILTRQDYENYEIEFECRLPDWCVSGLYLNVPRNGAYRAGLEIELNNVETETPHETSAGAVFRKQPPSMLPMKVRGQWNHVFARLHWPRLFVKINGHVVQDFDLTEKPATRHTLRRGAIGFQNLGIDMQVRNLALRRLPNTEHAIRLFNGKDLSGWRVLKGDAQWGVRDGAIVSQGHGYLYHHWIGQDFDLRLMVRTTPIGNGGIFFRWQPGSLDDRGNEVQILDVADAVVPTGSIYHFARGNDLALTPQKWELLQIYVRGNRAWTYLNGIQCAETDRLTTIRPGYIVLQMHENDSEVEFKDLVLTPRDEKAR